MKILFSFIVFILCLSARAQSTDTTQFERLSLFPVLSFDHTSYFNSEFSGKETNGEINLEEMRLLLQFSKPIKEKKLYFLSRINVGRLTANSKDANTNARFFNHYYSVALNLGAIQVLPKRWSLVYMITPTVSSDFEDSFSHEDFIWQVSIIANKRANRYLEYGFGVSYNTRFGRQLLVPIISLNYKRNNWQTLAVLPAYVSAFYCWKSGQVGGTASLYGNVYNAHNPISEKYDLDKLGYSRINLGPELQQKIYGAFYLNAHTGLTVYNRIESINNHKHVELQLPTKPKFFFNVGVKILK